MPEAGKTLDPSVAHISAGRPDVAAAPLVRFRRRFNPVTALAELWSARTAMRRLAGRELRVRYRRAFLGFGWAVVTPIALMITFTLVLRRITSIPTNGVPYPLFAYIGLVSWTCFSSSVSNGSLSLLNNIHLLKRAYLPREIFPLSSLIVAAVDFALASAVLLILFPAFGYFPRFSTYWVPLYVVIQFAFTTGVVLFISGAVVYLRDLRHVIALGLQIGLFATPVVYGLASIPARWRLIYVAINPLATVIDGYRRAILYDQGPDWTNVLVSGGTTFLMLVVGYWAFKKLEAGVADIS